MRHVALVLVLVLAASSAHAEGPLVLRAGIGLSADRGSQFVGTGAETRFGPGLQADIAYRVIDQLALGVHVALARTWERDLHDAGNIPGAPVHRWHELVTSLQLGVAAHWSRDRFWLSPWIGIDDRASRAIDIDDSPALSATIAGRILTRQLAFGLGGGADLYVAPSGHRVGVYVDIARGQHRDDIWLSSLYLSAGVAYRYW